MKKVPKLTPDEETQLKTFIGTCVFENIILPPTTVGGAGLTVQDILHQRSIASIEKYADHLERLNTTVSRSERKAGKQEKTIVNSNITFSTVIANLDLIIKHKERIEYDEWVKVEKVRLEGILASKKSKKELITETQEKLRELES